MVKKTSAKHTVLANKLTNIARRMKANERNKNDSNPYDKNIELNETTKHAYLREAACIAGRTNLIEAQQKNIKQFWKKQRDKDKRESSEAHDRRWEDIMNKHISLFGTTVSLGMTVGTQHHYTLRRFMVYLKHIAVTLTTVLAHSTHGTNGSF